MSLLRPIAKILRAPPASSVDESTKLRQKRLRLNVRLLLVVFLGILPAKLWAWDANIVTAFQLELFRNPALTAQDHKYMAQAILMAKQGHSLQDAQEQLKNLSDKQVKELLKQDFKIEYYEIPEAVFNKSGFNKMDTHQGHSEQVVHKNGVNYIRWFIHPLHDSKFIKENFQAYRGTDTIWARLTSSRSLILWEPSTNHHWSLKTSLTQAHGPFKNKSYKSIQAQYHFQMSELVQKDLFLRDKFFLEESFVAKKETTFDEGQIVRSLKSFQDGSYVISLASFLDPAFASQVATANGYADATDFLKDRVMPALGETMGHLYEKYGLIHNSFHSQNITVQLDSGKGFQGIMIRDPDFDVNLDKYRQVFGEAAADSYLAKTNVKNTGSIQVDFSILNGMFDNLHMSYARKNQMYQELAQQFYLSFIKRMTTLRGIDVSAEQINEQLKQILRVGSGARPAVILNDKQLESVINLKNSIAVQEEAPKLRVHNTEKTKADILSALSTGDRATLNAIHAEDAKIAWFHLEKDFLENPKNAALSEILNRNDAAEIRRLLVFLNTNTIHPSASFFEKIFREHTHVVRTNEFVLIFQSRKDTELMKLFINFALPAQVEKLWDFRSYNQLLDYPQEILNRFIVKLTPKARAHVTKAYRNILNESKFLPALRDRSALDNEMKFNEALRVSKLTQGPPMCSKIFKN